MSAPSPLSLVLADSPLRDRLVALRAEAEALRDAVAGLDLEIETLRGTLAVFDARLHAELRDAHTRLRRIGGVVRHLERWAELLDTSPRPEVGRRARRLDSRRRREVQGEGRKAADAELASDLAPSPSADAAAELKTLYRRLARRYHPDLARDEEEQLRAAGLMARINALYRSGDLDGLRSLADQALGAEPEEGTPSLEREVALLEERCARFRAVLAGLEDELTALHRCPIARLWREVTARQSAGDDAIAELRGELGDRAAQAYDDVRAAARALEEAVRRYNRSATGLERGAGKAMGRAFDAHLRQPLVRLSLESLAALRSTSHARARAAWLLEQTREQPELVRLVLFTYAAELVPHGLETLATLEDVRLRYDALGGRPPGLPLEEALVEASDLLELGVRRAGPRVVQTGLRFCEPELGTAVPLALRSHPVRAEFRRVLGTLGERTLCPTCTTQVFAVPLYRLRGLDDLHASVCPRCGQLLKSYWMPRGKDVQAVLNDAFLDLELVTEWTFRLGRASVSMQLLPGQVEALSVGQLKRRFVEDVLARHAVEVGERQVQLLQGRTAVPGRRALADCASHTFSVAFAEGAGMTVAEALERVRYRIRTRFRPEAEGPGGARAP